MLLLKNMWNMNKENFIFAFTLAEVLITLTIIGVVAAMVIPALINKATDMQTVTAVKKAYSTLSGAYDSLVAEYDDIASANNHYWQAPYAIFSRMNISKTCDNTPQSPGCFPNIVYQSLKGGPNAQYGDIYNSGYVLSVTTDGMAWAGYYGYPNCDKNITDASHPSPLSNWCTRFFVDVNGPNKGPAQFGRDLFEFFLTSTGVYPAGAYYDIYVTPKPLIVQRVVMAQAVQQKSLKKGR